MDLLRFDRVDRIATEVLAVVVWLMAAAVLLVDPVWRWWRGDALMVDVPGDDRSSPVKVADPTLADHVWTLLPAVVAVVALAIGAWMTIRLLRSIAAGDPFGRGQVRRLRIVAALLLLVPPAVAIGSSLAVASAATRHDLGGWEFTIDLPVAWLLAGLVVAALAQAFEAGGALRDEVEGLV